MRTLTPSFLTSICNYVWNLYQWFIEIFLSGRLSSFWKNFFETYFVIICMTFFIVCGLGSQVHWTRALVFLINRLYKSLSLKEVEIMLTISLFPMGYCVSLSIPRFYWQIFSHTLYGRGFAFTVIAYSTFSHRWHTKFFNLILKWMKQLRTKPQVNLNRKKIDERSIKRNFNSPREHLASRVNGPVTASSLVPQEIIFCMTDIFF